MKVILLGAPGSGKGTQAAYITEDYHLPHISTGDLFRENIKNQTPLGKKVQEIMSTGELCPDGITVQMVKERLAKSDCEIGYLLDGFPRNVFQAEELDKISAPDMVINIDVDLSLIEHRITGRRSCEKCRSSFHTDFIGQTEVCPECGGKLIIRKDDTAEVVKERIAVYTAQTAPLVEYYSKQNKLVVIDGNQDIQAVYNEIKKVLG